MIPRYRLNDYVFDDVADTERNLRSSDYAETDLTVGVGDAASVPAPTRGRVTTLQASLSAAAVSDFTVAVTVGGRPLAEVTIASGDTVSEPIDAPWFTHIRGDLLGAEVTAADAGQTGTATVQMDLEAHLLQGRPEAVQPDARDRFERQAARGSYLPPAKRRTTLVAPSSSTQTQAQQSTARQTAEERRVAASLRRMRPGIRSGTLPGLPPGV